MLRPGIAHALRLALAAALLFRARVAHAESTAETAPPPSVPATVAPPAAPPRATVGGLSLLAMAGYGATTNAVRGLDLAPYGAAFGVDAGFTFRFGLRLGAYVNYSLGKSVVQHEDPLIRRSWEFDADTSSLNAGLSVGYDVPLYLLVLRYDLSFGVTSMQWDFGDVDPSDVRYGDAKNPNVGFHFAPGLALLWPHGPFEAGVGFNYFVQTNYTIPSGFLGKLLVGVKL
jgi:hypothetical protein